MVSMILISWAI